jgi:hypothetical protein
MARPIPASRVPAYHYSDRYSEEDSVRSRVQIPAGGRNRSVAESRLNQVDRRAAIERMTGVRMAEPGGETFFGRPARFAAAYL